DLHWMKQMISFNQEENYQDSLRLAELMFRLNYLNKPVIAFVQGAAYGGGVGLIACCDIVIATENASFCFSETRIGLIPAVISPYVIEAIGARQARRYFLTAEKFSAQEAQMLGLVHHVIKKEQQQDF